MKAYIAPYRYVVTKAAEVPAKDLVIDAKAAAKKDSCRVLAKIAKVKESSADVPLFKIFQEHGLALEVEFSFSKLATLERYPYIDPRKLFTVLGDGYFHKVLGVPAHLAKESLELFWEKFRVLHPNHQVFSQYVPLATLIPYYLHGDGGRGFKKDPIEILSMLPALGAGSNAKPVDLSSKRKAEDIALGINLRGSSGTTRFLFAVLSSLVYKHHPTVFDELMRLWGKKLESLFADGFEACGSTWRIVILGFTGDSPFIKKVAHLNRSFNNVRKTHSSKNDQKGCCWLCMAGKETRTEHYPFEHLGFFDPAWISTQGLNNPLPWAGNGGPLLQHMLLDPDESPAAFFKADFFHVYHAGVGKDFAASAVVYSMSKLFGLGGIDRDLKALNDALAVYVRKHKTRLHCGFLTKDLLGYNSTREYPEGKWSKNMDTAIVMKFVVDLLQQRRFQDTVQSDDILKTILASATAIGAVLNRCLEAEYFMSDADCVYVIRRLGQFCCFSKCPRNGKSTFFCLCETGQSTFFCLCTCMFLRLGFSYFRIQTASEERPRVPMRLLVSGGNVLRTAALPFQTPTQDTLHEPHSFECVHGVVPHGHSS